MVDFHTLYEKVLKKDKDDPCEPDWVMRGTKVKNGKTVPRCIPQRQESVNEDYDQDEMVVTQLHFIEYAAEEIRNCFTSGCDMESWFINKLAKVHGDMQTLHSYMEGRSRKMEEDEEAMSAMSNGVPDMRMYSEAVNSGGRDEFQKFFNAALKKFGAKGPDDLKPEKRKEFFDYVDRNWKAKNESVNEKLSASDDAGEWVKDFKKSDAPQFKGKSKKKRQEMAVAAYLDAKRGNR